MSPGARVRLVVGLLAVAAAGTVVGVVDATRQDPAQPKAQCSKQPSAFLVPGVASRYRGTVADEMAQPAAAAARALEPLAQTATDDAVVQFNYGIAAFCAGYVNEATQAFVQAKKAGYDTVYEMRADEILHPQYFAPADGLYPLFEPAGKNVDPLLVQGVVQQREGHQHSAERLYARAARLHPGDDQAQVAAAVGRFDESNLVASFSHLGPLVRRFPHSQSVRFHLGLLLAWTGQRTQAEQEFRLARSLGPHTALGNESNAFLTRLGSGGTQGTPK